MSYPYNIKGGIKAHFLRRILHVLIILFPLLYYAYDINPRWIIALLFLNAIMEGVRLTFGWTAFGQRTHERYYPSSFAWTILSVGLVLLCAPQPGFATAIVSSCALVDPLLGELRARSLPFYVTVIVGVLSTAIIWVACARWYGFSMGWAFLMAPVTVAAEWPNIKGLDDNATMQLIPLMLVLLLGKIL